MDTFFLRATVIRGRRRPFSDHHATKDESFVNIGKGLI
jgi:hypothetical protein